MADNSRPSPHDDYSGLQVVEPGLEVAEPRQGLSQNKTWEQTSHLPEALPSQHDPYKDTAYPAGYAGSYTTTPNGGYSSIAPDYNYQNAQYGNVPPQEKSREGRICGLRRNVFWAILAIVAFAVVAAIAIGVGVGLGTRNNSSDDNPAPSSTTSASASASATNALPAATATATAGLEVSIVCPTDNETLYTLPSQPTRKFILLCGRDYSSQDGASDLYTKNTTTFAECLDDCANQEGCTAVGWGNYYGTNTCWLKSKVGPPNWSTNWYSAVEDDSG